MKRVPKNIEQIPEFVQLLEGITEFPFRRLPIGSSDFETYGEILRLSAPFESVDDAKTYFDYAVESNIKNVTLEDEPRIVGAHRVDDDEYENTWGIGYRVSFDSDSSFGIDREGQPFSRSEDKFIVAQYLWGMNVDLIATLLARKIREVDDCLIRLGCRIDKNRFYDSEAFTSLQDYLGEMEWLEPGIDFQLPDWSERLRELPDHVNSGVIEYDCGIELTRIGVDCFSRFDVGTILTLDELTQHERQIVGDYLVFTDETQAAIKLAFRYGENWRGYLLGLESGETLVPTALTEAPNCPPSILLLALSVRKQAGHDNEVQLRNVRSSSSSDTDDTRF